MPENTDCIKGRPCLIEDVHSGQSVTRTCCFFCNKKQTAAGLCPFHCHVSGKARNSLCKEKLEERYGDIE
jgi:hypothetical protein